MANAAAALGRLILRQRPSRVLLYNMLPFCLLLAGAVVATMALPAGAQESVSRASDLRAEGRGMFEDQIRRFGRIQRPDWEVPVQEIGQRLQAAIDLPGFDLTIAVIGDSSVNASVFPGGYVLINQGLFLFLDSLVANETGTSRPTRDAYLASVLAHELAHVTLGHTGSAVRLRRGVVTDSVAARAGLSTNELEALRTSRQQEEAADLAGALYMLRGGWPIQAAIDLMQAFDSLEYIAANDRALEGISWLRSHPRSSDRAASLGEYRARLQRHQRALDDARLLLEHEADPATALAMLDRVVADFPYLPAARHARAAALQQLYFASASVQALRVRASTPTIRSRFFGAIRGVPGDVRLLARARADYVAALALGEHQYTLANLAVLDAYAGDTASAVRRIERALALAKDDPDVRNAAGVVYYLTGRLQPARGMFEQLVRQFGDSAPTRAAFNYGRVLIDLGDAEGREVLRQAATREPNSAWGKLALSLAGDSGAAVASPSARSVAPTSGNSQAPAVSGVRLGMSPGEVVSVLGEPDERGQEQGAVVWRYGKRGLLVAVNARSGVSLIVARDGTIDGVAVGSPLAIVRERWGVPSESEGDLLYYNRDGWYLAVQRSLGIVRSISVGK